MCCEAHAVRPRRLSRAEVVALFRLRQQREAEIRREWGLDAQVIEAEWIGQDALPGYLVIDQPTKVEAPAEVAKELVLA